MAPHPGAGDLVQGCPAGLDKEVWGRDPDDPEDLLVLALALKQADLGAVD